MANRRKPAYRDPKLLAQDIFNISDHLNAPVMIIGDIFQAGEPYGFAFLQEMKKRPISNPIAFEFFVPPSRSQLEKIAEAIPHYNLEISPESHDEEIRRAFGRPYDNSSLERMIRDAIDLGCRRIDVFFMTGLPKQTSQSVLDTVDYCRSLLERFRPYHKLLPFISPLAPFLDPGSMVFEEPETYGYRLLHRTVEEHRKALLAPSWKYTLNYETEWMTRDEIVTSTYEAGKRLNRLKAQFGLIDQKTAESVERRIDAAVQVMKEIDRIVALSGASDREIEWGCALQGRLSLQTYSMATVCGKKELEWPTHFLRMNLFKILKTLLTRRKPNVSLPAPTGSP
jgi:B12-binding domain/radical SAM domain protein